MLITAMLVAATLAASPEAEHPSLRIGDAAPAIDISDWIRSPSGLSAITPGDGNIYLIDFWATWCAPCIAGFPALSELQQQYADKGVFVVALSDEPRETVEAFLAKPFRGATHGDRMQFVVATDPDASVRTSVLEAMWKYYIPQTAVIDRDGTIVWMGIPEEDGLAEALGQIVAGDYDFTEWREAYELRRARNVVFPALLDEERWADAEALAGDDWERVNQIAARIVLGADGAVKNRDLDLANRLAARAFVLSGETEPFPLHIRAAIAFEQGRLEEAVELQRRALDASPPDGQWVEYYRQTLDRYEAALAGG